MNRNIFRRRRTKTKQAELSTMYTANEPNNVAHESNSEPETYASDESEPRSEAVETADRLERELFSLYTVANRPDIIWTEDGPEYGDTYDDADDPELAASIRDLEVKLDAHIAAHREELAADHRWSDRASSKNYYGGSPITGELLSPADTFVIPDSDGSTYVMAAVRELYGVRVAGQFVVYDSRCVDTPDRAYMCMAILPDDGMNMQAMGTALDTGRPYGREVLRARVECGRYSLTNITTTGSLDDRAALRVALTHFNSSSTDAREHAVFRAVYLHLTQEEIR